MIRIAVAGAGRMGQAIVRLSRGHSDLAVTGLWVRDPSMSARIPDNDIRVSADLDDVLSSSDVLVDFSLPEATTSVLDAATRHGKALVCGVSGLNGEQMAAIDAAATQIPLLYDRNMSQGIAVLDAAIRRVVQALGPEFEVEIRETHHIHKKDAPSGTALKLGESIAAAMGIDPSAIHYESMRQGDVPGDHAIVLTAPTERLEFRHSVTTRDVFAEGALVAARWLAGQKAGRYSMQDVLFAD